MWVGDNYGAMGYPMVCFPSRERGLPVILMATKGYQCERTSVHFRRLRTTSR